MAFVVAYQQKQDSMTALRRAFGVSRKTVICGSHGWRRTAPTVAESAREPCSTFPQPMLQTPEPPTETQQPSAQTASYAEQTSPRRYV